MARLANRSADDDADFTGNVVAVEVLLVALAVGVAGDGHDEQRPPVGCVSGQAGQGSNGQIAVGPLDAADQHAVQVTDCRVRGEVGVLGPLVGERLGQVVVLQAVEQGGGGHRGLRGCWMSRSCENVCRQDRSNLRPKPGNSRKVWVSTARRCAR
jgi:hypothetical protein